MSKGKATGIIIPDDVRKIIEDNQTEKGIPTFTGSLCEIVRRQNEQQKISADVLDELKQFLANEAVGIRLSSRQAERNSAVLIRAVNQLLHIANVAAYFDEDNIPWFQDHGLWHSRDYEPYPGDLIFIDWEADGNADHVEIVTKFEKGTVYTVGGNRNGGEGKVIEYSIKANDKRIYGYGTPQYATLLFPVPDCQKVLTEFSANGGIVIGSATKDLTGYKVVAAAAGTIQRIEPADDDSGCVGVVIDHGGDTSTEYRNFRLSPGLKVGDTVNAGDVLGTIYGADPASLTTTRKTTTTQHAATTSRKSTSTTTSRKSTSATSSTSVTSTTSTTSAPRIDPKNVNRISFYLLIDGKRIDPFTKGYLSRPTEEPPKP